MEDYANDYCLLWSYIKQIISLRSHGRLCSHTWYHISVDIVFNFVPADLHCIFLLFFFFTIWANYAQIWQQLYDQNCLLWSYIKQIILLRSHGRLCKWHWHKNSNTWFQIVLILFLILYLHPYIGFRTSLQFGLIMHRQGNTYMIKTVCYEVTSNKLFYWGAMFDNANATGIKTVILGSL